MQGNNVLVYIYYPQEQQGLWIRIGCVKTNDIRLEVDTKEVSSPTTGDWKEYITERKGWSITVNYLVLSDPQIRDILNVGTTFKLSFCPRNDQANGVSGVAIMRACDIKASRGNLIQGIFTFQGTGELE